MGSLQVFDVSALQELSDKKRSNLNFANALNTFTQTFLTTIRVEANLCLPEVSYFSRLRSYNPTLNGAGFVREEDIIKHEKLGHPIPCCNLFSISEICDKHGTYLNYFDFLQFPILKQAPDFKERMIEILLRRMGLLSKRYCRAIQNVRSELVRETPYLKEIPIYIHKDQFQPMAPNGYQIKSRFELREVFKTIAHG